MSEELNVWTFEGCSMPSEVRSAEYVKGYQQASADVVEWLRDCELARGIPEDPAELVADIAAEIIRRFGKDA